MKNLFELLVLLFGLAIRLATTNESCWIHTDICNVRAEIFQNFELSNGIAMQIDCLENSNETTRNPVNTNGDDDDGDRDDDSTDLDIVLQPNAGDAEDGGEHHDYRQQPLQQFPKSATYFMWQRRFMGIQSVILDGCQTPLNTHTYGLEFLPICVNVTKIVLQHFHMDSLKPLECSQQTKSDRHPDMNMDRARAPEPSNDNDQQLDVEYLHLQFNEIASIEDTSFQGHYPHLRVLEVQSNCLKTIQAKALHPLRSLEHLKIINESVLILKFRDLFEFTAAISIHLAALRQMTSEIFQHLPETLQSLYVADTAIEGDAVDVNNSRTLNNLTIINCSLERFTLRDIHSTVKSLNLNGNALKSFAAFENQLKELDLSNNRLGTFTFAWLGNLTSLERLALRGNHLKILSLNELILGLPNGHYIDLRENLLQSLQDEDKELPSWLMAPMRLKCDQNPWDCLWLHEFAHEYPEKFRLLQYEKFISKINVNGLQCIPAEKPLEKHPQQATTMALTPSSSSPMSAEETPPSVPEKISNISSFTVIYGGDENWDFKRNQRAEALIIVFMLPLGIAFLFLLLYMWIYCQKMFHLSYYKDFSCVRKTAIVPNPSQRFDIVRQVPTTQQNEPVAGAGTGGGGGQRPLTYIHNHHDDGGGGYEVPLHGMCSECNCKTLTNTTPDKCTKPIHITYEESPQEIPHQIYEEIISVDEHEHFDPSKQHHVHYDHLRFE